MMRKADAAYFTAARIDTADLFHLCGSGQLSGRQPAYRQIIELQGKLAEIQARFEGNWDEFYEDLLKWEECQCSRYGDNLSDDGTDTSSYRGTQVITGALQRVLSRGSLSSSRCNSESNLFGGLSASQISLGSDPGSLSPSPSATLLPAIEEAVEDAEDQEIAAEFIKLFPECHALRMALERSIRIYLKSWVNYIVTQDVQKVIFSIGSNEHYERQRPVFARASQEKVAILNIDLAFTERHRSSMSPTYSCAYLKADLDHHSHLIDQLIDCVYVLQEAGRRVAVMHFSDLPYSSQPKIKRLVDANTMDLGGSFSFILGQQSADAVKVFTQSSETGAIALEHIDKVAMNHLFSKPMRRRKSACTIS